MASIYKAYDIRGIYPSDINEEIARKIGRAYLVYLKDHNLLEKDGKILVGRDVRHSSPSLAKAIIQSITQAGVDVDDAGVTTTDAFYYAIGSRNYMAGLMVTASHNPPAYNGFKCVTRNVTFVSGKAIGEIIESTDLSDGKFTNSNVGKVKVISVLDEFVEAILEQGEIKNLKRNYNLVLDPGNGTAVPVLNKILDRLPVTAIVMNGEMNGNFPGRGPDPYVNNTELGQKVLAATADFGVAWDNDSDRILFVDNEGHEVSGDLILALLARFILKKKPGSAIVYETVCSKTVPEVVTAAGGQPILSRVGHIFIKKVMKEKQTPFAGEMSGHFYYYFSTDIGEWYAESTWLSWFFLMHLLAENNQSLSQAVAEISKYHKSKIITFNITDPTAVVSQLKQKYADASQHTIDGLTVDYGNWWFNVRPSNTEPILKLIVEADSSQLLNQKLTEVKSAIDQFVS